MKMRMMRPQNKPVVVINVSVLHFKEFISKVNVMFQLARICNGKHHQIEKSI